MNYRDLQNISNLSQQILVEGANEDHNVLNRWPYTSPYLQEATELDESGKNDARIRGNIKSFGSNYTPPRDWDQSANRGKGAVLNAKQKEKQRRKTVAKSSMGEGYDLYDIILSHLLDEGYAETLEQAQVIMVNMSEDWRESIVEEEEVLAQKGGVPGTMRVKPTKEGGFLGIGAKTVNKPVAGSFKRTDIGSEDAARYNTGIDKKFGSADNIDNTSAANVQYAANRAGHSGYMKVKDPGSLPNTGIPNRPTPGRASDQNQARQMSSDIVRMNRR